MPYHSKPIPKGVLGEVSKIDEEYLEFKDAIENENPVMGLLELSDLLGAIEAYTVKNHNISITELLTMTVATSSAFKDGTRESSKEEPFVLENVFMDGSNSQEELNR